VTAIVDDGLALACLIGRPPRQVARLEGGGPVVTTGCWYLRLCRALVRNAGGFLSGRLSVLPEEERDIILRRVWSPPPGVLRVVGLPDVAPSAAVLATEHRLAVALALDTGIHVDARNDGPRLRQAAFDCNVEYVAVE
jgi:hypothetical protein